ncbi:MAG: hypothetical protein GYB67_01525 [Chloroflexi bacterium]|nr:hypothetical protein [Chloroflexota bacterium]
MSRWRQFIWMTGLIIAACAPAALNDATALPTLTLIPVTDTLTPTPVTPSPTPRPLPGPADLLPTAATAFPSFAPTPEDPLLATDPIAAELVALARRQIATELDLPSRRVQLLEIQQAAWGDSSLGCPLPDQPYTQVEAAGYRIRLGAGDATYLFHTDFDRIVRCDPANDLWVATFPPTPDDPLVAADPSAAFAVDTARRALASDFAIPVQQIQLLEIRPATWPDGSLGCPNPDISYTQAVETGYQIVLGAGDNAYLFRSGFSNNPRLCDPAYTTPLPSLTPTPEPTGSITPEVTDQTDGSITPEPTEPPA